MPQPKKFLCPDCDSPEFSGPDRREFLKSLTAATAVAAAGGLPLWAVPRATAAPEATSAAETAVKALYETLTDDQKNKICFDWDYKDRRGLLRTHVSNNWHITEPAIDSAFYTKDQRARILDIFKGIFNPDWHERLFKQLKDDSGGKPWGAAQNIALFGTPGSGKFEFVMTGRHMTVRADGDSETHVALGGPIFHGHAASGFNEKVHHPGNIFWHQAELANKVYQLLDGKQQKQALVERTPRESAVGFRAAKSERPGIPTAELSRDQNEALQKVLLSLIDPYRKEDQEEVQACLKKQGGLDQCHLAFYKEGDIGNDGEWDNWRLEGPAFVWYFRGQPHVHIWIHVADDPAVVLNAKG